VDVAFLVYLEAKMTEALSVIEHFQESWGRFLNEFRDWITPDTKAILDWKTRPLKEAIAACQSRMIDDAMSMWAQWRKHQNSPSTTGGSAFLPVMLTAFESVPSAPSIRDIRAVPYWKKVIIPSDPQQRVVQMRTTSMAVRAQVVMFASTPHDIAWLAAQFVSFVSDEDRRYLGLNIHLGDGIYERWPLTLLDNSLYANTVPLNEKNLLGCRVDLVLNGLIPQVVGLSPTIDMTVDVANRPTAEALQQVVVEADVHTQELHIRWVAEADNQPYWITLTMDQLLRLENSGDSLMLINGKYLRLWSK
jgi:hypothetical protein